jgi:undecaprenyl-phosphate galactose phosphotransferase
MMDECVIAHPQSRGSSRALAQAVVASALVATDLAVLGTSLALAVALRVSILPALSPAFSGPTYPFQHYLSLWWIPLLYLAALAHAGVYTRRDPSWEEARRCLAGVGGSALLLFTVLSTTKLTDHVSRSVIVLAWAFAALLLPPARVGVKRALWALGPWRKRVLLLGRGPQAQRIRQALRRQVTLGYDVVEVVDDPAMAAGAALVTGARDVVVALPDLGRTELLHLVEQLRGVAENVLIAPDLSETPVLGVEVLGLLEDRALLLRIPNNLLKPWNLLMKRAFDVAAGALLGVVAAPVVLLAALAVRLDSPGPAFHVEPRIGRGQKAFPCFKLRTMHADADRRLAAHLARDPGASAEWARYRKLRSYDPRVTRVGRILRRYGIDELPQLLNVLRGEMSLVGPRPYLPGELALVDGDGMWDVRPGLTGLWQVSGKNALDFRERTRLDRWYVGNWSLWLDLIILVRTLPVLLRGEVPGPGPGSPAVGGRGEAGSRPPSPRPRDGAGPLSPRPARGRPERAAARGERGFTLVEILVSLTIMALILIPLMAGFDWSMGQAGQSNTATAATNLARQALEYARAQASNPAGFPVPPSPRAPVAGTPFQREVLTSTNALMNWETVTVNVYYGTSPTPLVTLSTVVSP